MTSTCPKCGSIDIHSSRSKSAFETFARVVGIAPRRCSACGWRGFRPRALFPARHGSNPEQRAAPVPEPPPPPEPPQAEDLSPRRRKHKHRHHVRSARANAIRIVLLAVALGIAAAFMVENCQ